MPAYSNFPKTRAAQMEYERRVLAHVRSLNRDGMLYSPTMPNAPWRNAMDRLEAKGLIRHYRTRSGWGPRGYVARGFLVRRGMIYRVNYERDPSPGRPSRPSGRSACGGGPPGRSGRRGW